MSVTIGCVGGYGDILFCEPIFRWFLKRDGVKPIVIIHAHQMWISQYIESAMFTSACPPIAETGSLFHDETFINLRYANQIFRGYGPDDHSDLENMMIDKYRLLGLPEDLWKTLDIKLFSDKITMIKPSSIGRTGSTYEYYLINEHSQAGDIKIKLELPEFTPVFYMNAQPVETLIDWSYRIYAAKENHHVSTSTFFLMQAIKNKYPKWNAPCYIYPRPNVDGLRGISQLKPDFNLIRVEK